MIRRALYRKTKEDEPFYVTFHGFFQDHKTPMAIIEDMDGLFVTVPIESIKLDPSTFQLAKEKNNRIIKPH